jgi:single-strand DNA-binding protein
MAATNINLVVLTGNLTADPELRALPSGTAVCRLRVAVNDRVKRQDEWRDVPYYFDVVVWAGMAENCARYLSKGRGVAVDGKLTWREYEDRNGNKRQAIEIDTGGRGSVQFLSDGRSHGSGSSPSAPAGGFDTAGVSGGGGFSAPVTATPDDDIPF